MIGVTLILVGALTSLATANVHQTFNENIQFSIDTKPDTGKTHLKINCQSSRESLLHCNFTKRHPIASEIDALTIDSCAFSSDGFRIVDCIDFLGVKRVHSLKLSDPQSPLKREHLQELKLDSLTFWRVNASNLPGDLLQDVEVRRNLIFMRSAIPGLPKGLLEHVSSIQNLHIISNSPVNLHRDDFASLTRLNTLSMISNRFVTIESGVFDGLENLQGLDLGGNSIRTLPAGIFHKLKNLRSLCLNFNQLNEIPSDLLRIEDSELRKVRLSHAVNSLPAGLFKDLRNLEHVELNRNYKLTSLPADLFSGAGSLKKVELSSNKIVELPAGIFDDAAELTELDLANNELSSLPENVFGKNTLQKLNLNYNKLTNLTEDNLNGLLQLQSLSIANNALTDIFPYLYKKLNSVEEIDISHNQLTLKRPDFPNFSIFVNCVNLRKLDASYNKVPYIFQDFQEKPFEKLNLAGNDITEISEWELNTVNAEGHLNLSSNKITSINFAKLEYIAADYAERNRAKIRSTVVDLDNNPVHCDCAILDLVRYLENKMDDAAYDYVTLNARRLRCAGPPALANRQVVRLNSSEIFCPVVSDSPGDACNGTCACLDYPGKGVLVVDCTGRNLTSAPQKIANPDDRSIELNLSGNQLEKVPAMNKGYLQNVVSLDLSSNKISSVTADVLAGSVRALKLQNNADLVLDSDVVKSLKGILL